MVLSYERDILTHDACYFVYFWHDRFIDTLRSFHRIPPESTKSANPYLLHILLVFFYLFVVGII